MAEFANEALPEGFVLDTQPAGDALPEGFVVDAPAQPQPALSVFGTVLPPEPPGSLETLDDTIRMLASGATFGFADEISAGINTLIGAGPGKDFDENLAAEMSRDQAIREREPGAALTAEIVGGVAGAVAGTKMLGAVPGAAAVTGSAALQSVPRAVRLGTLGATAGAASGAGNAAPGERASGAVFGAALGGFLGGVGIPLAKKGVEAAIKRFTKTKLGKDVRVAAQKILQALQRDDLTPDEAFRRVSELGPEGRLVDVGNNTRRLGRAVAGTPSKASKIATDALEARQAGQGARITETVNKALDPTGDFAGTVDELHRIRSANARPLYEKAYAREIEPSEELISLFRRPALERAWRRAQTIARNEGENLADNLFTTRPDGGKIINPDAIRDMKTLDFVKRGLDDLVETSRDPVTGKISGDVNRGVDSLRRQYVKALDRLSPDYKAARAAWSGPSRSLELMERGRRFMRADEEITTRQLARMTDDEKLSFRMGAARELRDMIFKTADGADAVKRVFGSELKRQRLRAVFPDQKSFKAFRETMEQEAELFQSRAIASPGAGSQTQLRQADAADLSGEVGGAVSDLARGDTGNAARRFLRGLFGRGADGLTPQQAETLSRALFTNDPEVNRQIIRALSAQRLFESLNPAAGVAAVESGRLSGAEITR